MNFKKIVCMSIISVMMVSPNAVQAAETYNDKENIQTGDSYTREENLNQLNEYEPVGYDGLEEIDADEISEDEMEKIPAYDYGNNGISTLAEYNSSADEINYSSSRGRDSLGDLDNGANMQRAYDDVEAYFEKIHNNYISISPTAKNDKYVLDALSLVSYTLTKTELKEIFLTVRYDHPEFFWIGTGYTYTTLKSTGKVSKASFYIQNNFINSNYIKIEKQEIEKAVAEYLDMADYYTDEYDIEKVFHDKLLRDTAYDVNVNCEDENLNSHNVAGALVDHVGVCESYAKTMQMLLNAENIENVYVTGRGSGGTHAWNQVKIHGEYYNLDATWDDMNIVQDGGVKHNYFNVKDSEFNSTHKANTPDASTGTKEYLYNIEQCNSDEYTWQNLHGDKVLSAENCNDEQIKKYIIEQINRYIADPIYSVNMKGEDYDTTKAIYDYINTKSDEIINDDDLSADFLARYTSDFECSTLGNGSTEFSLNITHKSPVNSESIDIPDELTIYFINNSKYLNPKILPEDTTDSLKWSSSNSSVADVHYFKGVIVPAAPGETIITAQIGNLSKQCRVTVKDSSYLVYKDDLENLYDDNDDRNEEDYVSTTWSAFKAALDNAEAVLNSDNVTQNQVDEAEAAIKEAIANLVEVGDKTELQKLYDDNKDKELALYTEASWAEFSTAMNDAEIVLNNRDAIQEEVDTAKTNLENSINKLVKLGDKTELQKLYDDNKDKESSLYTEDSWTGFSAAMNDTELVLNNKAALQEDVDNSVEKLETARDNLIELGDTTSLQKLYDSNKYKKEYKYTSETWDDFKEALDNTEALLAQEVILKSDSDSAYDKLNNAVENLKEAPTRHNHLSSAEEPDDKDIAEAEEGEEIVTSSDAELKDQTGVIENLKSGWIKSSDNKWNFYDEKGAMKTGWMKDSNNLWYHLGKHGIMDTGWFKDTDGQWYYLNEGGDMKTGWYYDRDTKWYHLGESGQMNIGWFKDYNGKWYYLNQDGSMAVNTMIAGYKLGNDGAWI